MNNFSKLKTLLEETQLKESWKSYDQIAANAHKASERAESTNDPEDHNLAARLHSAAGVVAQGLGKVKEAEEHYGKSEKHEKKSWGY